MIQNPLLNPYIIILVAAVWGGMFLLTLHPATGFFGGIVFMLIGSMAPVVVNCCLAWGFASLLPTARWAKIVCSILFAFLLALIPALPALYVQDSSPPTTSYEVREKVILSPEMTVDLHVKARPREQWWKANPTIFVNPMYLPWTIGGNEGCMCMFFEVRTAGLYSTILAQHVASYGNNLQSLNPGDARSMHGLWFVYAIEKTERGTYDLKFDVMRKDTATATFWQKDIPEEFVFEGVGGGNQLSFNTRFYGPALRILFSDNIPTWIMAPSFKTIFPYQAFNKFLQEAVEWPQTPAPGTKTEPLKRP